MQKNRQLLFSLLILSCFICCKKNEKSIEKRFTENTVDEPKYLVSQLTITDPDFRGDRIIKYKYDNLNRIKEIHMELSTAYYYYDSDNKLIKSEHIFRDYKNLNTADSLIYNKKSIKIISTLNSKKYLPAPYTFILNDSGLITAVKKGDHISSTYEYNSGGNLSSRKINDSTCSKTDFKYDNKRYPFSNAAGQNPRTIPQKNNIIEERTYDCFTNQLKSCITYTYQYNKNGYPIIQKEKKDGKEIVTRYEYILK